MSRPPRDRTSRTIATFGITAGGPVALFSGLLSAVTVPWGTPRFLVGLFLASAAVTALSLALYLIVDLEDRYRSR